MASGQVRSSFELDASSIVAKGESDAFVVKLDAASGALEWSQVMGGASFDFANDLAIAASGDVAVTGTFAGTADLAGASAKSAGEWDIFVALLGATDGKSTYARAFGTTYYDSVSGIAVDGAGRILMTGHFSASLDFGAGPLSTIGVGDAYLVKMSPAP